jgi:hypothetical protein
MGHVHTEAACVACAGCLNPLLLLRSMKASPLPDLSWPASTLRTGFPFWLTRARGEAVELLTAECGIDIGWADLTDRDACDLGEHALDTAWA